MIGGLWCVHEELETITSKDQLTCENQCSLYLISLIECSKVTFLFIYFLVFF